MGDTIAAIATGHQVAAIGIVRMSGDQSIEILQVRQKVHNKITGIIILISDILPACMIIPETGEEKELDILPTGGVQHPVHGLPDHVFIQR